MNIRKEEAVLSLLVLLCLWTSVASLLSPKGVNYEGRYSNNFSVLEFMLSLCKIIQTLIIINHFFFLLFFVSSLLLPEKFAVLSLMNIKNSLRDPHNILENWDETAVDPCNWNMVTCSLDGLVTGL